MGLVGNTLRINTFREILGAFGAEEYEARRLPGYGTTAAQYQVRRLAETLSVSVKGPKRVPLSFQPQRM